MMSHVSKSLCSNLNQLIRLSSRLSIVTGSAFLIVYFSIVCVGDIFGNSHPRYSFVSIYKKKETIPCDCVNISFDLTSEVANEIVENWINPDKEYSLIDWDKSRGLFFSSGKCAKSQKSIPNFNLVLSFEVWPVLFCSHFGLIFLKKRERSPF